MGKVSAKCPRHICYVFGSSKLMFVCVGVPFVCLCLFFVLSLFVSDSAYDLCIFNIVVNPPGVCSILHPHGVLVVSEFFPVEPK